MPAYRNFILDKGQKPASGQVFTKFRACKRTANADEVTPVTAATDIVHGVVQYDVTVADAAKGKRVSSAVDGIVEWEAGAAIARGALVTCDTSGRCVTAATGNRVHGVAEQAAGASGNRISVMLRLPGTILA